MWDEITYCFGNECVYFHRILYNSYTTVEVRALMIHITHKLLLSLLIHVLILVDLFGERAPSYRCHDKQQCYYFSRIYIGRYHTMNLNFFRYMIYVIANRQIYYIVYSLLYVIAGHIDHKAHRRHYLISSFQPRVNWQWQNKQRHAWPHY